MYYNYDQKARMAYDKVLSFKFDEASVIIEELKEEMPENLAAHHIENYIDLFKAYTGAEDYSFEEFKKDREDRLDLVLKGDPNSPYYLFVQAEIRLHAALVRWKFGEYLGAFSDVTSAYKLLEKNKTKFPWFVANKKDLAILHAFVGTIPSGLKWGVSLFTGLEGTIDQGVSEIEEVLDYCQKHDFIFQEETQILYVLLKLHLENNKEAAWKAIQENEFKPTEKTLHCYIMAEVAMFIGKNDEAIKILQQRPTGQSYYDFHLLDYMLGVALLRRIDPAAAFYFRRFLNQTKGQQLIKSAYQKLAWLSLVQENIEGYKAHMASCRELGSSSSGEDENAMTEAEADVLPHPILVKARLLFDGGYYPQASKVLAEINPNDLPSDLTRLEYFYRFARILHAQNHNLQAEKYYRQTIKHGRYLPNYYACNAALQLGIMFEKNGEDALAKNAFDDCLSIKPKEYRYSIHQQAKAGLNRLGY